MITNLYKEVLKAHQEGATYGDISVLLTDAGVLAFGGLYRLFGDSALKVLLYIIHAYSEDSPKLLVGADSIKNKREIMEHLSISADVVEQLISFDNADLNNIIINYLNFQGNSEFKHLKMAEDMYDKMYDETYRFLSAKEEGGKDFDQKKLVEAWKQLSDMREQKNNLKLEIKDKYAYIYENVKEIEKKGRKGTLNASLEASSELKNT